MPRHEINTINERKASDLGSKGKGKGKGKGNKYRKVIRY